MADSIWDYIPLEWHLIAGAECRVMDGWIVAAKLVRETDEAPLRWKAEIH